MWVKSGQGLPRALAAGVPANAYPGSPGYVNVNGVTDPQMCKQIKVWRVSAVVAVARPDSQLGQYLTVLLGRPAAAAGDVLAWRTDLAGKCRARLSGTLRGDS
jgi:hypothetical protein